MLGRLRSHQINQWISIAAVGSVALFAGYFIVVYGKEIEQEMATDSLHAHYERAVEEVSLDEGR